MKRSKYERRVDALQRLHLTKFSDSKAKRVETLTEEEWNTRKDADIAHLEDLIHGRTAN